jgi:transcriptional regulator with XRE-family HTH domain
MACALDRCGTQSALARLLGRGQSTVHDWLHNKNPVPISVALLLEEELGIPRGTFREDLRQFPMGMSSPALLDAMTMEEPRTYLESVTTWEFDAPKSRRKQDWVAEDCDD